MRQTDVGPVAVRRVTYRRNHETGRRQPLIRVASPGSHAGHPRLSRGPAKLGATVYKYRGVGGCSIGLFGRTATRYGASDRTMYVDSEVLMSPASTAIYVVMISRLESTYDARELLPDARRRILNHVFVVLHGHWLGVDLI